MASVYHNGTWSSITSTTITAALRKSATAIGDALGIAPQDISTRSMRTGGTMALLLSNVDTNRIKLLGERQHALPTHYRPPAVAGLCKIDGCEWQIRPDT
mmetsp:Transcript_5094/g.11252  ORF Transcript_5094/g.11252 Transcript_5094/m.11252 type:complete len:100 (-) Transcript_5094:12-311(-)